MLVFMTGAELAKFVTHGEGKDVEHTFFYQGAYVAQSPRMLAALDALYEAVRDDPPIRIVEIGTYDGGFTKVLCDHDLGLSAKEIHTFDIGTKPRSLKDSRAIFHQCDVFKNRPIIESLISPLGRTILFCDGGNKEREVKEFSPSTKPGDIVLCHDFLGYPEVLDEAGGWPFIEALLSRMKDNLESSNLDPFLEIEMQRAAWGCWKKRDWKETFSRQAFGDRRAPQAGGASPAGRPDRARLDSDRTEVPKTRLLGHALVGQSTASCVAGPADTYENLETGERVELHDVWRNHVGAIWGNFGGR